MANTITGLGNILGLGNVSAAAAFTPTAFYGPTSYNTIFNLAGSGYVDWLSINPDHGLNWYTTFQQYQNLQNGSTDILWSTSENDLENKKIMFSGTLDHPLHNAIKNIEFNINRVYRNYNPFWGNMYMIYIVYEIPKSLFPNEPAGLQDFGGTTEFAIYDN